MAGLFLAFSLLLINVFVNAQNGFPKKINKNRFLDSATIDAVNTLPAGDLPVISMEENARADNQEASIPSLLYANRDLLVTAASYHFSIVRFRMRGYNNNSSLVMNGIPMNNPHDGNIAWHLWSGLNDVMRNVQSSFGLRATDDAFGDLGSNVSIDTRSSRQRVQTLLAYAISNRTYQHRVSFTHSTGLKKNGWAYTISANYRYGEKGFYPGTFYDGKSYFIGIDKKLNEQQLLSFSFFGADLFAGKQSPVLEEATQLLGTKYYNAYWGYQAGSSRNANTRNTHQPVLMLRHDLQMNNHTGLQSTIAIIAGNKIDSGLDWYKAADPRPDYYRKLPSYQTDPVLQNEIKEAILQQPSLLQINWQQLYNVNRNSKESINNAEGMVGNVFTGLRSHYIVEDRITALRNISVSTVYHTLLNNSVDFVGGISLQLQRARYFKRINDLLGGDYYVNWNQFAMRDYPADGRAMQQDLFHPDRILKKGDAFGYDYTVHTLQAKSWLQLSSTLKRFDYFAATELTYTNYQREGAVANGLFPNHSIGKSPLLEFPGFGMKGGITYKLNGRKYFYLHAGILIKPPLFDDVFIAPKMNAFRQDISRTEKMWSTEMGYSWNAPEIKLRITGFITWFADGMNVSSFYHDGYANFVNYALSGINKLHTGLEWGADYKISSRLSCQVAGSIDRYYFNSRQNVVVTADNNASIVERTIVYAKNYRVGGTPQEAFSLNLNYQSTGYFFMNISGNYFSQQWIDFNPMRRTQQALAGMVISNEEKDKILQQTKLANQYTIDFSAGTSTRFKIGKARKILSCFLSINNLLNQPLVAGGYEQLRFDVETKNTEKFPPKYFYAMGLNFSINLALRL